MAAMLVKNQDDGKPIPNVFADLRDSEKISCTASSGCWASYTLACGQTEVRDENILDIMRRKARELLKANHPHSLMVDDYLWGEPQKGWIDNEAATKAGL